MTVPFDGAGTVVVADVRTPLGRLLYRYRQPYWDTDFDVLRRFIRPGSVFVDCGANVGQFTLTAAPLVGAQGRVYAIEPAPEARANLQRSLDANGFDQVEVLPFALGAQATSASFIVMGCGGGLSSFAPENASAGLETTVEVKQLDHCIPADLTNRIAVVKMDIEGAEFVALQGATRLLAAGVPFLVEIEDPHLRRQGASSAEVFALFARYGYVGIPTPGPSPNVLFTVAHISNPD